jgi:hypothetical protein
MATKAPRRTIALLGLGAGSRASMLKAPSALIASRSRWLHSPSSQARLAANVSSALLAVLAFLIWRRRLA